MPYGYSSDPEFEESTDRVMMVGVILLIAMVAVFPLYLAYEPGAREDARRIQLESVMEEGATVWEFNCAGCHGPIGEGGSAPALNSKQFLQSATDEQARLLISVGVPGTTMGAYSQDHGGPLTSEQIRAVTAYIRGWEGEAPDVPDWRDSGG
jgi:mono/diheme cytochrome c family protein